MSGSNRGDNYTGWEASARDIAEQHELQRILADPVLTEYFSALSLHAWNQHLAAVYAAQNKAPHPTVQNDPSPCTRAHNSVQRKRKRGRPALGDTTP